MKKNNNTVYIVATDEGFGWNPSHGGEVTPSIFPSEDLAEDYISLCRQKFPEISLNIFYKTGYELIS